MTTPMPDDGGISLWQVLTSIGSAVVVALATAGTLIGWLLKRIEAVRAESGKKIEDIRIANDAAINKLRNEVLGEIEAHRRDYREDRQEAQRWREHILSTMVTRPEMDRITDRQTNELFERLDVRITPLLNRNRESRR